MSRILRKILLILNVHILTVYASADFYEEKFRVDDIKIFGNRITKEYIVLREMLIKKGDSVDDDQIEVDRKRILNIGIFERVRVIKNKGDDINILEVHVTERWYLFPFPTLDFEQRDIKKATYGLDIVHYNFRGRAERLTFSINGGYKKGVHLQYRNPWYGDDLKLFNNTKIHYGEEKSKSREIEQYEEKCFIAETLNGHRFGLFTYTGLILSYRDIKVTGNPENKVISSSGRDRYVTVNIYIDYDNRDLKEYPSYGWKNLVSFQKVIWSNPDFEFSKLILDITYFKNFFKKKVIFIARNYINFTFGDVALHNKAYLGYTYKIRGHFFDVYEGDRLFGGSFEARIPLGKPSYYSWEKAPFAKEFFKDFEFALGLHFFLDYGKVWDKNSDFNLKNLYYGAGMGIHFRLPYDNLLRLDLAYNGNNYQIIIDRSFLF